MAKRRRKGKKKKRCPKGKRRTRKGCIRFKGAGGEEVLFAAALRAPTAKRLDIQRAIQRSYRTGQKAAVKIVTKPYINPDDVKSRKHRDSLLKAARTQGHIVAALQWLVVSALGGLAAARARAGAGALGFDPDAGPPHPPHLIPRRGLGDLPLSWRSQLAPQYWE